MKVVPFDGELDAPADQAQPVQAKVQAVPFDGELDPTPDTTASDDAMRAGDPMGIVNAAQAAPTPAPPPAPEPRPTQTATDEDARDQPAAPKREVGVAEAAARGYRTAQAGLSKTFGEALAAVPMMAEHVVRTAGEQYFGVEPGERPIADAAFKTLVDPAAHDKEAVEPKADEQMGVAARVSNAVGALMHDLPVMILSGGASAEGEAGLQIAQGAKPVMQYLADAVSHGWKASRPIMLRAAEEKADQVLKAGGSEREATVSALTAAMSTALQNSAALAVPGGLTTRVASGAAVGAATGEGARVLQNAADPESMHRDFDPTETGINAIVGAAMSGAMGERATPRAPDRIDLGYDPTGGKSPVAQAVQSMGGGEQRGPSPAESARDPVADIFKTGSVQDAAAAAERAAGLTPESGDLTPGDKIRRARPLRPVEPEAQPEGTPDVSADGELSRMADGAGGERGDLPSAGVDADLGAGSPGRPAVVDGGDARQAEAVAAPVADGLGADAVAPRIEPFATKPEANMAGLKEGAVAVPVEGGFALQLNTRPYSDRERTAAQMDVDRLNRGLAAHAPDMEPARLLSTAPSPEMAVGRRIGRLLGVKVVFIEDHTDFRGVAESGVAYVSPQTKYPAIAIVGHEVFHAFVDQHPQEGEALKERVRQYLNQDRVNERLSGVNGDRARAEEEAFADLHGAMWMDPKFWAEMRKNDPNSFRKLAYAFMQAISHATQHMGRFKAEDFVSDVDTVRKIVAREMATLAREEGISRHNPVEAEETGQARGVESDKAAQRNPLKDWLSGLGIDPALKREFAPGLTEQRSAMGRGGSMFRQGGLNLDALAERAAQDGYLARPDAHAMYDLMARAFGGERVAPTFGEGQAEAEMQRRVERAQQANEDAARDWSLAPDEVEATGFGAADPDVQAQVRRLVAQAEAHDIDGEGILETLARRKPNATTDEYLAAARDALQAALPPEGEAGARDRGADSRGQGAQEGAGLETYTEADLRTRAARDEAATRADKAATAEADRRDSAESPDSFRLTGSDRAADEAAARGQAPMFSDRAVAKSEPLTVTFGGKTYRVDSAEDAAAKWNAFRQAANMEGAGGVSDIGNGVKVMAGGRVVATVAYNGRVKHVEEAPKFSAKEPERKPGEVTREQARQMGDLRKKAQTLQELQAQGGDVYKAQLSRADRAAILESVRQLRTEGVPAGEARKQAVERLLEDTHAAIEKMQPGKPAFSRKEDKPFYSALARGIEGINAKSQPAEGWRAQIQGLVNKGAVKADEVEWSGLNDWLKMKSGKVSKQEVQDFIAANGVQVHEVTKGELDEESQRDLAFHQQNVRFAEEKEDAAIKEALDLMEKAGASRVQLANASLALHQDRPGQNSEALDKAYELLRKAAPDGYDLNKINDAQDESDSARRHAQDAQGRVRTTSKYGNYTLPGGENYREVLLTLPQKDVAVPSVQKLTTLPDGYDVTIDRGTDPANIYTITPSDQMHGRPFAGRHPTEEAAKQAAIDRINAEAQARASDTAHRAAESSKYNSGHWDESNVLSHIRLNDRVDAEGHKVLFVEELQSDFGADHRKSRMAIDKAVDDDFLGIVERMKKAGVLEVKCD